MYVAYGASIYGAMIADGTITTEKIGDRTVIKPGPATPRHCRNCGASTTDATLFTTDWGAGRMKLLCTYCKGEV